MTDYIHREAVAEWEAWSETREARETVPEFIVYVQAADDVLPARSWREACQAAHALNADFLRLQARALSTDPDAAPRLWSTPYPRTIAVELRIVPDLGTPDHMVGGRQETPDTEIANDGDLV